jgi:hypothetical protein
MLVGITQKMYERFGIKISSDEHMAIKKIFMGSIPDSDYFPVPFHNSLLNNYTISKIDLVKFTKDNLDGKIIEFSFDFSQKNWKFYKIRNDRQKDFLSGNYFGNNYKVAEKTLQSILNPLTLKVLISNYDYLSNESYFQKKSEEEYKFVKKFNNFVKKNLIMRFKSKSIIDLASGRGGDLNKYSDASVENLLMLEIDRNSIDEIINRKYNILLNKKFGGLNLIIENMDLNKFYKKNIEQIEKRQLDFLKDNKNNIFCHFAFHYFTENEKMTKNICEFINYYLKPGASFIITILDGSKIYELLKTHGEWKTNKYYIKLCDKSKIFSGYGHKIKIKLPFSNEIYDEFLIDLFMLDKVLSKHGIYRKEDRNFDKLLAEFESYNKYMYASIDNEDRLFLGLYKYVVYTKK